MPAYLIVETDITDPEQYEQYKAASPGAVAAGGGRFLVRGACRALGVREQVTSPTYTIGHRYHGARTPVSHLDLYRFAGVSAAEGGDLEPYFDDAIAFVEWPEAGEGVLPAPRFAVRLRHADGDRREVSIDEC